jgi:chaperonin cofactor prefoldin
MPNSGTSMTDAPNATIAALVEIRDELHEAFLRLDVRFDRIERRFDRFEERLHAVQIVLVDAIGTIDRRNRVVQAKVD